MRKQEKYRFNEKRKKVCARFHELKKLGQKNPPQYDLCSFDFYDFRKDGKRRSEKEQSNLLARLYSEKLLELRKKEELELRQKDLEKLGPSVSEVMQKWLDHIASFRNPLTVREYALTCDRYVKATGDHPIKDFRRHFESDFLQFIKKDGLNEHTQAKQLRQLQGFWKWAFEEEYISKKVGISKVRPTQREPGIYTIEQLDRMESYISKKIESVPQLQKKSIQNQLRAFWMLRETGMRGNEVRCLLLENIYLEKRMILIREDTETGFRIKGRAEASVPISNRLMAFLEDDLSQRENREKYFCDTSEGKPQWTRLDNMTQTFSRMQKQLDIRNVKPLHGFRSFVATRLLENGIDLSITRDILRHKDIQTTLSYVNRAKMPYQDAVNRLSQNSEKNRLLSR